MLEKSPRLRVVAYAPILAAALYTFSPPIFLFCSYSYHTKTDLYHLKREKWSDTFLVQIGQWLYLLLVVGHTFRTLELGFTSHSLTFNLSFLLFFLHIPHGLGLLSFFSFLFLYFTGSLQSLAWLWAHLVAFNFHVNCFFNDFSIPSPSLIPFIM